MLHTGRAHSDAIADRKRPPSGPWGGGANAPDLDDLIRKGFGRLSQNLPAGGARGVVLLIVIAQLGLSVWTAYYTVPGDSVAVVQRLGKHLKIVPPGLHLKLSLVIDTTTIAPVRIVSVGEGA